MVNEQQDKGVPSGPGYSAEPEPKVSALRASIPNACMIPPEGWWCSRKAGHEGPCAARPDSIAGHKTFTDGSHAPLYAKEANDLWSRAEAEKAQRCADMPDEASAIRHLFNAQQRLKELGWQDPIYAPKDGSPLDIIELGSTGIHRGHYEGEWPTGSWWIFDGDVWPCRPALARAAQGIETAEAAETVGLSPEGESPTPEGMRHEISGQEGREDA